MPIEFKKKPGLVIYFTAGDPDLATTREMAIAAIDNGADVIELGVPFSDPLADGPVIQRASERAVARGTRLTDVLGICKEIRAARAEAGIILFSYLNPVLQMGLEAFAKAAKEAGADGVLLTDMIVEEAGEYLRVMHANGLMPVFLAAPTSPDERLKAIAENSQGFVYAISRVGITGTQTELASDARGAGGAAEEVYEAADCAGVWGVDAGACAGGGRVCGCGGGGQRDCRVDREDACCGCAAGCWGVCCEAQWAVGAMRSATIIDENEPCNLLRAKDRIDGYRRLA